MDGWSEEDLATCGGGGGGEGEKALQIFEFAPTCRCQLRWRNRGDVNSDADLKKRVALNRCSAVTNLLEGTRLKDVSVNYWAADRMCVVLLDFLFCNLLDDHQNLNELHRSSQQC